MKRSEKILASAVGGIVLVLGLGLAGKTLISKPLKEYDKRISLVREKIEKAGNERRKFFDAEDKVKVYALKTFADTLDESSAASGEMLTRLIVQSGLKETDFTRTPIGARKLKGATEMGWSVNGEGPLNSIVNLVYILENSPYLSRVDGLSVTTGDEPGTVRVRFRFLTLVIEPAPEVTRKPLQAKLNLESPERQLLNPIVTRDILRPYVKRPPAPPPGKNGTAPGNNGSPGTKPVPPGGPESFRVVSLSEWLGQPEVHVRDLNKQETHRYVPGDPLAGGKIVMIDYRPMPMPGNEYLESHSRVIIQIGEEYFAIERGKTLAEKRKLPPDQLPSPLAKAQ